MVKKHKLSVILPDGKVATRVTSLKYKVVVCGQNYPPKFPGQAGTPGWKAIEWYRTEDEAARAMCRLGAFWREIRLVPVEGV